MFHKVAIELTQNNFTLSLVFKDSMSFGFYFLTSTLIFTIFILTFSECESVELRLGALPPFKSWILFEALTEVRKLVEAFAFDALTE